MLNTKLKEFSIFIMSDVKLFALLMIVLMVIFFFLGRFIGHLEEGHDISKKIKDGKQNALQRSRAVLGGLAGEQLAPFFPDFPCNPCDVRFVGKPVDFVGFPGAAEGQEIKEVLFIEVKTGNAVLSKREKEIKAAINAGRVRYVEYRVKV